MSRWSRAVASLLVLLVAPAVRATNFTYYYSGTVVQTDPLFGSLQPGQTFTGSFSFNDDPAANPDRRPQPAISNIGYYDRNTFDLAGRTLARDPDVVNDPNLAIYDNFDWGFGTLYDGLAVAGIYQGTTYWAVFYTDDTSVFQSDQLPPAAGRLDEVPYTIMHISNTSPHATAARVLATITRLSDQPIPEPSAAMVALTAIVPGALRRKRR